MTLGAGPGAQIFQLIVAGDLRLSHPVMAAGLIAAPFRSLLAGYHTFMLVWR